MIEIIEAVFFFVLFLYVLIKSSDWFLTNAKRIGLHLKWPPYMVGTIIVAFGTSIPELVSSITATINNTTEVVSGNVLGSNIANVLLIVGIGAILAGKLKAKYKDERKLKVDIIILVISELYLTFYLSNNEFTSANAIIAISLFLLYVVHTFWHHRKTKHIEKEILKVEEAKHWILPYFFISIAIFIIYFSANMTIKYLIDLSVLLSVNAGVISIISLAIGTSLPELMVTIHAIRRKDTSIAFGNIIGSNIFNSLMVMGVPGLMKNLIVEPRVYLLGVPFMLLSSFLFIIFLKDKKVVRWEGVAMVGFYCYFIFLFFKGI